MEAWLDKDLRARFEGRILIIDQEVADRWGLLTSAARNSGMVLPVIDGLLAATALEHNLTLVTRDTGQIPSMGVAVFNPWGKELRRLLTDEDSDVIRKPISSLHR